MSWHEPRAHFDSLLVPPGQTSLRLSSRLTTSNIAPPVLSSPQKHSSFKTDLALGGLATSEVLPTDMRMGTINERDLRALTGHAKQFRGELDLGDFAWVDTVHVNLTKKDLPRGVARSAMAREGGATPLGEAARPGTRRM